LTCHLEIDELANSTVKTLERALERRFLRSESLDAKCDRCKATGSDRVEKLSRCPEVLIITLKRFKWMINGDYGTKDKTVVEFPLDNLVLDPYYIDADEIVPENRDRGCQKPFKYDCYAVVQHTGETIRSGHYFAFVRDLSSAPGPASKNWYEMNDQNVGLVKDVRQKLRIGESYILFYQRQKV
jgi:ubiquitin carboxyl-terminal hydrolase 8